MSLEVLNANQNIRKLTYECKKCTLSTFKTRFKTQIIEHLLKEHEIKLLQCLNCQKEFKDEWKFKRHMESHDDLSEAGKSFNELTKDLILICEYQPEFKCPKCTLSLQSFNLLQQHLLKSHSNFKLSKLIMCTDCGSIFRTRYKLNSHLSNAHSKTSTINKTISNISNNRKRKLEEKRVKKQVYECLKCDRKYKSDNDFQQHMDETHKVWIKQDTYSQILKEEEFTNEETLDFKYECVDCNIYFRSNQILTTHKHINHCLKQVYQCCSETFNELKDFLEHGKVNHSQKTYTCTKCDIAFESKELHRAHTRQHQTLENNSTHSCATCKVKFNSKDELDTHLDLAKHKYTCYTCLNEFDTQNSLHNHLATHQDLLLFVCDTCLQAFKTRRDLSRHLSIHNSGKTCKQCQMTFKTSFHLKRHELTRHTNLRPFKCDTCEMTFARKDKLKQHEAKHVDRPIYSCVLCEKGFYRKEHLKDHEITRHTKQYPFECESCKKGFVHSKDLHRHIRVRHLGMVEDQSKQQQNEMPQNPNFVYYHE